MNLIDRRTGKVYKYKAPNDAKWYDIIGKLVNSDLTVSTDPIADLKELTARAKDEALGAVERAASSAYRTAKDISSGFRNHPIVKEDIDALEAAPGNLVAGAKKAARGARNVLLGTPNERAGAQKLFIDPIKDLGPAFREFAEKNVAGTGYKPPTFSEEPLAHIDPETGRDIKPYTGEQIRNQYQTMGELASPTPAEVLTGGLAGAGRVGRGFRKFGDATDILEGPLFRRFEDALARQEELKKESQNLAESYQKSYRQATGQERSPYAGPVEFQDIRPSDYVAKKDSRPFEFDDIRPTDAIGFQYNWRGNPDDESVGMGFGGRGFKAPDDPLSTSPYDVTGGLDEFGVPRVEAPDFPIGSSSRRGRKRPPVSGGSNPFEQPPLEEAGGLGSKALSAIGDILGVSRSLMTAGDIVPLLRQGLPLSIRNPREGLRATGQGFRSFFSPEHARQFQESMELNPNLEKYREAGLRLGDVSDVFPNEVAHKIPLLGKLVQASERGFGTFIDSLKTGVADKLLPEAHTADDLTGLGTFLNDFVGHSDRIAPQNRELLSKIFFSPQNAIALADQVNPFNYYGKNKRYGKFAGEADKTLGTMIGAAGGALGAGALAGGDVETNWNSPDFGKLRFGNTRIDPWGGRQSYVRNLANTFTATKASLTPQEEGTEPKERFMNPLRTLTSMEQPSLLRSKLAPIPGMAADLFNIDEDTGLQEDLMGRKIRRPGEALPIPYGAWLEEHLTPMAPAAMWEGFKDLGKSGNWKGALSSAFLGPLSGNIDTYNPDEMREAQNWKPTGYRAPVMIGPGETEKKGSKKASKKTARRVIY